MNLTYQDYENATSKIAFLKDAVSDYKASRRYTKACEANAYYLGENTHILGTKAVSVTLASGQSVSLDFAKIPSDIFKRLVIQLASYLLTEGISINGKPVEDVLGKQANRQLLTLAKGALIGGLSYGVVFDGAIQRTFTATEMFDLRDEWTGDIMLAVRFWDVIGEKYTTSFMQVFEADGFTVYKTVEDVTETYKKKTGYNLTVRTDGLGSEVLGMSGGTDIPIVAMFANEERRSELTTSIKAKIDNLDEIVSRNASFVADTSKIFWAMNTVGNGDASIIADAIKTLTGLGMVVVGDEESATPTVVDPASASRLDTKASLESDIYRDFMGMNMEELTKTALTATAIKASATMLDLRANDLYYHVRDFIEAACNILGVTVESVEMKKALITNDLERVQMISLARGDLTTAKALELNPMIEPEEVEQILTELATEQMAGLNEPEPTPTDPEGGDV